MNVHEQTPRAIDARLELAQGYLDQLDARAAHQSLAASAEDRSIEAAYLVQDAFHALLRERGHRLVGYKIALTSKAMQEFCGVDQPLSGVVFEQFVHESPATVRLADHRHLGVEFEVAVRLGADLPPASVPHDRDSVAAAVASCQPAFELVEDRNADYSTLDAFDLVAENAWNAGVVLGPPVDEWRQIDLEHAVTRLETNGTFVGEGRTGDALGHPMDAVAWLANHLNQRGRMLERGQFVMTGSSIVTQFPEPGDDLEFTIEHLGQISLACR